MHGLRLSDLGLGLEFSSAPATFNTINQIYSANIALPRKDLGAYTGRTLLPFATEFCI